MENWKREKEVKIQSRMGRTTSYWKGQTPYLQMYQNRFGFVEREISWGLFMPWNFSLIEREIEGSNFSLIESERERNFMGFMPKPFRFCWNKKKKKKVTPWFLAFQNLTIYIVHSLFWNYISILIKTVKLCFKNIISQILCFN